VSRKQKAQESFPGGNVEPLEGELRVAVDKRAYADIIGHAVLEPEVEVCGVLVGKVGEDAHGPFLHVTDVIRGEAAKQQGAQVTFTHDTWNHIHGEMDARHEGKEIVGWYHTHGGFGIFLSDMDKFIHQNFFSAPHHVAYVFDPLAGGEGFFHAKDGNLAPLARFWLGGRERKALAGVKEPAEAPTAGGTDLSVLANALQNLAFGLNAKKAQGEAMPGWLWGAAAGMAAFLALGMLFGIPGRGESPAPPGLLLVVERNGTTGEAIGLPLARVVRQEGQTYRDASGRLFVGLDLSQASRNDLLGRLGAGQAPPDAPAPQVAAEPPPVRAPGWRKWLWPGLAGVLVLGAMGAGGWLLLRRQPRRAR